MIIYKSACQTLQQYQIKRYLHLLNSPSISSMKSTIYYQNPLTNQFIKLLDEQKPAKPTLQSIMQAPANMYSIIKQMYNSFKKDNQSRILQNKIYELKIHDNKGNQMQNQSTPVSLESLCQHSYSKNNQAQHINHLILLKAYLPTNLQKQLVILISKQIIKINDLPIILKSFKRIMKSKQCLHDRNGLYKNVQNEMMNKLLSFTSQYSETQIRQICSFLIGLPYLDIEVIEFLGKLFEKVNDVSDFEPLKSLYTSIYTKLEDGNLGNQKTKHTLLKSLMKITIPEHVGKIKQIISTISSKVQNKQALNDADYRIMMLLQKQAIDKIETDYKYKKEMLLREEELKEKDRKMIDFIFVALETEALIHTPQLNIQSRKFWSFFIMWHQLCASFPKWREYISEHMVAFLQNIFQLPKATIQVIKILLQIEGGINVNPKIAQISSLQEIPRPEYLSESVSNYFTKELLSSIPNCNKYLNNKHARQLVALDLMRDQKDIYQSIIFNPSNLAYIDIVLETFELPNPVDFFKRIISNATKKTSIQVYLVTLLNEKPKKFKDFFIKIDSYNKGEIFELQQYFLLRFFEQSISNELMIAFLRNMTAYLPSKFSIEIINRFITKFKGKPQQKIVYYQAVRTLHIILSTREAEALPVQFKKHLKDIVTSNVISSDQLFKNVPEKMTSDLTKFYSSEQAK